MQEELESIEKQGENLKFKLATETEKLKNM
jgi:structural maintenance of chromosome 4